MRAPYLLMLPFAGLAGCATIFGGGSTQAVTVRSVQPACFLIRTASGIPVAQDTTPATVRLRRKEHYEVEFRARGFTPQAHTFKRGRNGWRLANLPFILGGPLVLIPAAIDGSSGAMHTIEPDTLTVSLEPSHADTTQINCQPLRP